MLHSSPFDGYILQHVIANNMDSENLSELSKLIYLKKHLELSKAPLDLGANMLPMCYVTSIFFPLTQF